MVTAFFPLQNPALDLCQAWETTGRVFWAPTKHSPRHWRIPRGCGAGCAPHATGSGSHCQEALLKLRDHLCPEWGWHSPPWGSHCPWRVLQDRPR